MIKEDKTVTFTFSNGVVSILHKILFLNSLVFDFYEAYRLFSILREFWILLIS